jgi:hypothetical protein
MPASAAIMTALRATTDHFMKVSSVPAFGRFWFPSFGFILVSKFVSDDQPNSAPCGEPKGLATNVQTLFAQNVYAELR